MEVVCFDFAYLTFFGFLRRNRTPPKNNINGKMPSVANSPATNNDPLVDAMASLALDSLKYVVGSRVLVKMNNGLSIKGEIIAYEPNHKIVMISKLLQRNSKSKSFSRVLFSSILQKVRVRGPD